MENNQHVDRTPRSPLTEIHSVTNETNAATPVATGNELVAEENLVTESPATSLGTEPRQTEKTSEGYEGWGSKLRDRTFRGKLIKTVLLCLSFVALGVGAAMGGPTFLDLQLITGTNVQQASAFFTAGSVGYVVGSLLGGLVYDLFSKSLLLILSLLALAALTIITPYCRLYGLMVVVSFFRSIFGGVMDPAVNAEIIRLWGGEGGMAMQAIHFAFALGGVIAPFFTEPFLAPRIGLGHHNSTVVSQTFLSTRATCGNSSSLTFIGNSEFNLDSVQNILAIGEISTTGQPDLRSTHGTPHTFLQQIANFSGGYPLDAFSKRQVSPSRLPFPFSRLPDWAAVVNSSGPQIVLVHEAAQMENVPQIPQLALNDCNSSQELLMELGNISFTNATAVDEDFQETRVHYAFLIAGLYTFTVALLLLADYLRNFTSSKKKWNGCRKQKRAFENEGAETGTHIETVGSARMSKVFKLCLLAWICVFYMLYVACEDTFLNFLMTFAVMQMDWSKSDGALLTSTFWGSFAAGRFACIWVSSVVTSVQLLTMCCVLMVLSFAGFLLASLLTMHSAVWVTTALSGAAMSAIFPAGLSWMQQELLPVTGRTTSAIALASMMILMVNQQVLGRLLETHGAIWLAYLLLGEAVACVVTFFLLLLFSRTRLRAIYPNTRHQNVIKVPNSSDEQQTDASDAHGDREHETLLLQGEEGQAPTSVHDGIDVV